MLLPASRRRCRAASGSLVSGPAGDDHRVPGREVGRLPRGAAVMPRMGLDGASSDAVGEAVAINGQGAAGRHAHGRRRRP
ncbi:MAG: hypothetical protein MZW92_43690 [Comamonadaceae bacterium]|nr:hypothetical protein [Comamonadaceae bacterium]